MGPTNGEPAEGSAHEECLQSILPVSLRGPFRLPCASQTRRRLGAWLLQASPRSPALSPNGQSVTRHDHVSYHAARPGANRRDRNV
jgi:hypothetical protein